MHVGMGTFLQNLGRQHSDAEVYRHGLELADAAEGLGFDSVWSAEHHFTDYHMCPNVAQFLTWVAARTRRVLLGSMVVVLPWHDPVRVRIAKHGPETFSRFLADLQVWGTPERVAEQLRENVLRLDAAGVIGVFSYGGMPHDRARDNVDCFARRVLPVLQGIDTGAQLLPTG